jgi:ferredoxin-type protein NapF
MDRGRRQFLSGAFLTREGRERLEQPVRPLGPFPPCHAGRIAADVCAACDRHPCVAACEPAIIRRHEPGHELAGVPYLDFSETGCTFCGDCIEACPSTVAPGSETESILGTVELDILRCLAMNGVTCMSCSAACEYDAIRLDALHRPELLSSACNGCGMCIGVCPEQALRLKPAVVSVDGRDRYAG